jgi:indole-3-glycerol phosphate synthase
VNVLDTILAVKRDEVAAAKAARSLAELEGSITSTTRSFRGALARPAGAPIRVLSEIKRASPSAGPIRPGADPVEIAIDYAEHGAAAISVLTDKQFFDGDLSFLARVRERVRVPLLRKDFTIDAYQIAEARAAGADAVLLIVAALPTALLRELLAAAAHYQLDALVEVHDRGEAEIAVDVGATLIGVNHRDLKTFTTDMTLTAAVAPLVPPGTVLVGESGIKTAADVRALAEAGAHAVLVGETLMRAPSPGAALRELLA